MKEFTLKKKKSRFLDLQTNEINIITLFVFQTYSFTIFFSRIEWKKSPYLAIEFRYWTRVLWWLGRRGQRWTSRRWKLVRILRASTWPVILGRVARFPIATFWWPIIAHRPSHFGLVRHTVARIQPSCRRQRDFWCWTAKISPEIGLKNNRREGSFVSLPKFQPLETLNESRC